MDKEVVCIYSGILLGHKKEWDTAICSNVDGPRDYHTVSELRQTNVLWYHLYVESKKKETIQMSLFTNQKHLIDIGDKENKFMIIRGAREGEE